MTAPVRLVYSSVPADDAFREQLSKHLYPFVQKGLLTEWHEQHISPGSDMAAECFSASSRALEHSLSGEVSTMALAQSALIQQTQRSRAVPERPKTECQAKCRDIHREQRNQAGAR